MDQIMVWCTTWNSIPLADSGQDVTQLVRVATVQAQAKKAALVALPLSFQFLVGSGTALSDCNGTIRLIYITDDMRLPVTFQVVLVSTSRATDLPVNLRQKI